PGPPAQSRPWVRCDQPATARAGPGQGAKVVPPLVQRAQRQSGPNPDDRTHPPPRPRPRPRSPGAAVQRAVDPAREGTSWPEDEWPVVPGPRPETEPDPGSNPWPVH